MPGKKSSRRPQYDPQNLLNAQPVIITVADPQTFSVQLQNQTAPTKFGGISSQTCYERIVGRSTPCPFCKMPETVQTGQITASKVELPNDERLLIQWSKAETDDGRTHAIETITNITDTKRRQHCVEALNQQLEASNQRFKEQAIRDGLTGLYHHSHFPESLDRACAQATRSGSPLSLLCVDLDHFKAVNDTHGHAVDDEVLRGIA